jgi:hypothetical protein
VVLERIQEIFSLSLSLVFYISVPLRIDKRNEISPQ